jgi:hypothetical protein
MQATTKITTLFDEDSQEIMTGEMYEIYPNISTPVIKEIQQKIIDAKLNRYFDCIQKAKIAAIHLGIPAIRLGSLFVDSTEVGVQYGYNYNPPLELHAWVQIDNNVIDFALAGTIEKGLKTKDEFGSFLIDRKPIILAGTPPPWVHYQTHEIVLLEDVHILDKEFAKELLKNQIIWK